LSHFEIKLQGIRITAALTAFDAGDIFDRAFDTGQHAERRPLEPGNGQLFA
jgi:hypothetical protein